MASKEKSEELFVEFMNIDALAQGWIDLSIYCEILFAHQQRALTY